MPHLKCLACKTCPHSTESQADPVGDLCPVCGSLLEPVGDLGEIVGYRVIETRGGTSPSGASGAGQVVAARELRHARIRLEIDAAPLALSADKSKPLAFALPARATKP